MKRCKRSDFATDLEWEQCLIESGASELSALDVSRIDLVGAPATGKHFLLYKSEEEGQPKESKQLKEKNMQNLATLMMEAEMDSDKVDQVLTKWEDLESIEKDDKAVILSLRDLIGQLEDEKLRTGLTALLAGDSGGEGVEKSASASAQVDKLAWSLVTSGQEKNIDVARGTILKRFPALFIAMRGGTSPSVEQIFKAAATISTADADSLREIVNELKTIGESNTSLPTGKICNMISYWLDKVVGMQNTQREIDALNDRMNSAVEGLVDGTETASPGTATSFSKAQPLSPIEYADRYKKLVGVS